VQPVDVEGAEDSCGQREQSGFASPIGQKRAVGRAARNARIQVGGQSARAAVARAASMEAETRQRGILPSIIEKSVPPSGEKFRKATRAGR
jgi:hypothetical protein